MNLKTKISVYRAVIISTLVVCVTVMILLLTLVRHNSKNSRVDIATRGKITIRMKNNSLCLLQSIEAILMYSQLRWAVSYVMNKLLRLPKIPTYRHYMFFTYDIKKYNYKKKTAFEGSERECTFLN